VWILFLSEGPFHSGKFEPKDMINWTATYRMDSDIPAPYYRWMYYDERVKQNAKLDHNYAANKSKKASCSIAVLLDIAMFCIAQFVMPLGTEGTKLLFSFFTQFQYLHLPNNILAITKSTCKSVGSSHCPKSF
jgi:hypothetical protein